LGKPVDETLIDYCGYTNQIVTSPLPRNPDCRCDHTRYDLRTVAQPLSQCSLNDLAGQAGGLDPDTLTFQIQNAMWVDRGACQCHEPVWVRRFVRAGKRPAGRCTTCHAPILPQPIFSYRTVAASQLGDVLRKPLRRLGAANAGWVLLRDNTRGTLLHSPVNGKEQP
jgi:hypothetical protein